jgi:small subunit ribosomal protein S16
MLVIRLTRVGKKNSPAYRVVVADKRKAVKRKFIEILGHYNPASTPKQLVINKEKSLEWISKGAQPSDTVKNLMCDLGILAKDKKVKVTYGKKTKKKDAGKETEEKVEKKEEVAAEESEEAEETATEKTTEEATPESQEETAPEAEENEAEKAVE